MATTLTNLLIIDESNLWCRIYDVDQIADVKTDVKHHAELYGVTVNCFGVYYDREIILLFVVDYVKRLDIFEFQVIQKSFAKTLQQMKDEKIIICL